LSLAEINFIIQTLILIILLVSFVFKNKAKFFVHGTLMFVTVFLSVASFLWFISQKAPTFTSYIQQFFDSSLNFILFIVHTSFTTIAVLLGIWIVIGWRFRTNLFCASKKKVMRIVAILWILGYFIGVIFYFVINTNLI
jgi:uncharacterized membrane protein YozB (DUF420 family)